MEVKFKNAACIYPYKKELKAVGFLPPIGLEYIATAIKDLVNSVTVVDFRNETEALSSFFDSSTDLALVSYN